VLKLGLEVIETAAWTKDQPLIDQWLAELEKTTQPKTRKSYAEGVRRFYEAHDLPFKEMTLDSVEIAFERMADEMEMSVSTLRSTKTPLRRLIPFLARRGVIQADLAKKLLKGPLRQEPQQERRRPSVYIDFRLQQVLQNCPTAQIRLIMFLTLVPRCVIQELVNFNWRDIHFREKFLRVATPPRKAGSPQKARLILLNPDGWDYFVDLLTQLPSYSRKAKSKQAVFVDTRGTRLDYAEIHKIIREVLEANNIKATPAQVCPGGSIMGEKYLLMDFNAAHPDSSVSMHPEIPS